MKKSNRFLCLLCIMALLFSAVPAVQAQVSPNLYFSTQDVTLGTSSASYCFLKMSNAENISAMDYRIIYDAENLVFSHINNTGFTGQSDVTVSVNTSEPGVIHVTLVSQNGLNGSNNLNAVYFKAAKDAKPGKYPVSVLVTDIYNSSLETVVATTQIGTITIKEAAQSVKKVNFINSVSPSTLKVGENVVWGLSANSLNNLSAGTFDFVYDETKLKYNDAELSRAMQNTVYDINSSIDGLVKISFASEKAITSGTNLVKLNFTAIDSGNVRMDFNSGSLYDSAFDTMVGNNFTQNVTISEPDIVVNNPDFKFSVPAEIASDKEFTIQAVLEGSSGVRAGDFVIKYDNSLLECTGVSSEAVSGAWVVTDKSFSNGQIRFSFMSNVDLVEDTPIVSMKFMAKNNVTVKSKLIASGTGLYDAVFNAVTLDFKNAEINVIRPEYTVNFYDTDGTTLLLTQKVLSGNSAIPPKVQSIRKANHDHHLLFDGWDTSYSVITENTDFTAVYINQAHTSVIKNGQEPTCTKTGLTEGKYCVICEEELVKQEIIPATGAYITAVLSENGVLNITGVLSDDIATVGKTYISVYDQNNRMLELIDATECDQSKLNITIENMNDAQFVKAIRLEMPSLRPLNDVVNATTEKQ